MIGFIIQKLKLTIKGIKQRISKKETPPYDSPPGGIGTNNLLIPVLRLLSNNSVGDVIGGNITTTTNYFKVIYGWDNSSEVFSGSFTKVVPQNGSYVTIVISTDSIGTPSGNITNVNISNYNYNSVQTKNWYDSDLSWGLNCLNNTTITNLALNDSQLSSINITGCINLNYLDLRNNELTSIDVSSLNNLTYLDVLNNSLSDLTNDEILSQLDNNGLLNGSFYTSTGRTSSSDVSYNNLINKGWGISI